MKRIFKSHGFCLISFFWISIQSLEAQNIHDVFTSSETAILYLGIDYTQARLINDTLKTGIELRDKYFPGINALMVNEPQKYDLRKAFNRSAINNNLDIVTKRNKTINAEGILSAKPADYSRLSEEDINRMVKEIDFEKLKGIGLIFIVEGMKKGEKKGDNSSSSVWVTFVDMSANKVLMTERIEGITGGGFSYRNYWANTIYSVIESIDKKKYKVWKRKYGK